MADDLIQRIRFEAERSGSQQEMWLNRAADELVEKDAVIAAQAAVIEAAKLLHTRGPCYQRPGEGLVTTDDDLIEDACQYCEEVWPCATVLNLSKAPSVSLDAVKAEAAAEQREKDAQIAEATVVTELSMGMPGWKPKFADGHAVASAIREQLSQDVRP